MSREEKKAETPEPQQDNPNGLKETDKKTDKRKPKKGLQMPRTQQK